MKRICSLILVLCMVLSMVVVPTLADTTTTTTAGATATPVSDHPTQIGATDTEVTVGGVVFTVIRTADDFKTKMAAGGNFILANDIDFGPVATTDGEGEGEGEGEAVDTGFVFEDYVAKAESGDFTFDGNGYTLSNVSMNFAAGKALFYVKSGNAVVKNLKITTGATFTGAGTSGLLFSNASSCASITVDNVDIHSNGVSYTANNGFAMYIGRTGAKTTTFKNCDLTGSFTVYNQINGGFVINAANTVNFENCTANVEWTKLDGTTSNYGNGGNRNAPFVGEIMDKVNLTFTNCTAAGTWTESSGGKWSAPFVSGVNNSCAAGTTVTFKRCENAMINTSTNRASAFVGGYVSASSVSHFVFEDCVISGILWGATDAWLAEPNGDKNTYEFKGDNIVTGLVILAGAAKTKGVTSGNIFENSAKAKADGSLAYAQAAAQKQLGVTDPAEIYGQEIGIDAEPVKGGMTVYRRLNAMGTYNYRNKPYREAAKLDIGATAETVTDNGVTYTVVRTVEQFKAMTDGNYILANDLDFNNEKITSTVVTAANIVFRGNTYALKNVKLETPDGSTAAVSLFAVTQSIKVQDLVVYATLNTKIARSAVLLGTAQNVTATFEGVTLNVDITTAKEKVGGFIGYLDGANASVEFVDCSVNGSINSTNLQVAGYVGCLQAPVNFSDCTADMDIVNTNTRVTPYVGQINANVTVNFSDCTASGTLIQTGINYGAASFVGCTTGENNPTINFTGCSTDMVIMALEQAGGFVSGPRNATVTPTITFKNCINGATIISASTAGAWAGVVGAGNFTVENCTNIAKITAPTIVTVVANENNAENVNDLSAMSLSNGEVAYALAKAQSGLCDKAYIFGQDLGTAGSTPKMGDPTVYLGKDLAEKDCYTNEPPVKYVTIPAGKDTVTVGGVTYIVIRDIAGLESMRGEDLKHINRNNYILANDIDMGGYELKGASNNVYGFVYYWSGIFDGNGYSITNYKMTNSARTGFFDTNTATVDIVVKNVTFGTAIAPINNLQGVNHNGTGLVAGQLDLNSTVYIENVVGYCDFDDDTPTARVAQKGGLVGSIKDKTSNESSVTMVNCTVYGTIRGKNKIGGLMGNNYSLGKVTMINCVNNATIIAQDYVGGMLGMSQVGGETYFENCVNNGTINNVDTSKLETVPKGNKHVGAIIGCTNSSAVGGSATLYNCANNGKIVGAFSTTALIGQHLATGDQVNTLNVYYAKDNAFNTSTGIAELGTAETVVVNLVALEAKEIADEAALKAALATSGVYTLTADIALTSALDINIAPNNDVTIILAGYTITGEITVSGAGTLTIKNGTLKATGSNPALTVAEGSALKLVNATVEANATAASITGNLNAEKATFTSATGNAVEFHKASQSTLKNCTTNGTLLGAADGVGNSAADLKDGMSITINGGKYGAIVWDNETTLTIKAGVIDGKTGDGLTIKNGTVKVEAAEIRGANFIKIDPVAGASIVLEISGGEFYGNIVVPGAGTIVTLSGGRYDTKLDNNLLAFGYEFAKGDNDTMYEIRYHEHVYGDTWVNATTGSHRQQCEFPGCTEGKTDQHKWTEATDNGDGTHSKVCTVCAAKSTAQPHKLTKVDNGDGTHSEKCSNCNYENKTAHTYGDATAIEGGKHEKACADCGNVVTEDCTAGDDGKCVCGATVGKKKGCKGSISGGLFVLLSVLAVPAVTVRKRKEDR